MTADSHLPTIWGVFWNHKSHRGTDDLRGFPAKPPRFPAHATIWGIIRPTIGKDAIKKKIFVKWQERRKSKEPYAVAPTRCVRKIRSRFRKNVSDMLGIMTIWGWIPFRNVIGWTANWGSLPIQGYRKTAQKRRFSDEDDPAFENAARAYEDQFE